MARKRGDEGNSKQSLPTGLWLLKHTQGIVTTATAIGILHFRTCHVVYFTLATLATSFTAKGLKLVIKQPRPPGSKVKKTSGMPSTHSASISFMGTYIMLTSLLLPLHPSISLGSHDEMMRIWIALFGMVAPLAVMWSRVRLGVHTPEQTVAGAALGIFNACLFFLAWNGTTQLVGTRVFGNTDSLLALGLGHKVGLPVDRLVSQMQTRLLK